MIRRFITLVAVLAVSVSLYAAAAISHTRLELPGPLAALSLNVPPVVAADASPYMKVDTGNRPVSWNPCAPINYIVNFTNAPKFAAKDLQRALAELSAASGFHFNYEGTTTDVPDLNWADQRYDNQSTYAPLIIAFANPSATNVFTEGNDQIGSGGSAFVSSPRGLVDVSGTVVIDDQVHFVEGFGAGYSLGTLFLHEVGHVLGLAEGPNPKSFTYEYLGVTNQTMTAADRAHLSALGSGGCRPAAPPAWS